MRNIPDKTQFITQNYLAELEYLNKEEKLNNLIDEILDTNYELNKLI